MSKILAEVSAVAFMTVLVAIATALYTLSIAMPLRAIRKIDSNFDSNRGGQLRTLGNSRGQYIGIIDMTRTPRDNYGQVAPNS